MKQQIKKWYDFYHTRYKLRKGHKIHFSQKFTNDKEFDIKWIINASDTEVRKTEIMYMYPLDSDIIIGTVDDDFVRNLNTMKTTLWLKK